jgi:hypothetical protein
MNHFVQQIHRVPYLLVCLAVFLSGCTGKSMNPTAPSSSTPAGIIGANADGSSLKVTAPVPQSPLNGFRFAAQQPVVLTVANATGMYASGIALSYRFEVMTPAGQVVYVSPLVPQGGATTSHQVAIDLDGEAAYTWQARAVYQDIAGPVAARSSFFAPPTDGFLKDSALYDPLINGKTVGEIHGAVIFIPGVGAQMVDFHSWIRYHFKVALREGEYSALVTGVETNTEGSKTRIFAMAEGDGDVTDNPGRMTVEKRGDGPPGAIAWRFLTSDGEGVDTVGAERVVREFDPNETYFWEADWRHNFLNVYIAKGGVHGPVHYSFGKPYHGFYEPEGHTLYAGGGPARGGPENQTVPGMIIRQIWVAADPRPSYANK